MKSRVFVRDPNGAVTPSPEPTAVPPAVIRALATVSPVTYYRNDAQTYASLSRTGLGDDEIVRLIEQTQGRPWLQAYRETFGWLRGIGALEVVLGRRVPADGVTDALAEWRECDAAGRLPAPPTGPVVDPEADEQLLSLSMGPPVYQSVGFVVFVGLIIFGIAGLGFLGRSAGLLGLLLVLTWVGLIAVAAWLAEVLPDVWQAWKWRRQYPEGARVAKRLGLPLQVAAFAARQGVSADQWESLSIAISRSPSAHAVTLSGWLDALRKDPGVAVARAARGYTPALAADVAFGRVSEDVIDALLAAGVRAEHAARVTRDLDRLGIPISGRRALCAELVARGRDADRVRTGSELLDLADLR